MDLPPVYAYAVETAIQLTLTERNENLRDIYIEAYASPTASEYIFRNMAEELYQIFHDYQPGGTRSDFYEMEIGSAGMMRAFMTRHCDVYFALDRKIRCFFVDELERLPCPAGGTGKDYVLCLRIGHHQDRRAGGSGIDSSPGHAL